MRQAESSTCTYLENLNFGKRIEFLMYTVKFSAFAKSTFLEERGQVGFGSGPSALQALPSPFCFTRQKSGLHPPNPWQHYRISPGPAQPYPSAHAGGPAFQEVVSETGSDRGSQGAARAGGHLAHTVRHCVPRVYRGAWSLPRTTLVQSSLLCLNTGALPTWFKKGILATTTQHFSISYSLGNHATEDGKPCLVTGQEGTRTWR